MYKVVAINTATTCSRNMPDSVTVTITPSLVPAVSLAAATGQRGVCQWYCGDLYSRPCKRRQLAGIQVGSKQHGGAGYGRQLQLHPGKRGCGKRAADQRHCLRHTRDTASSTVAMTVLAHRRQQQVTIKCIAGCHRQPRGDGDTHSHGYRRRHFTFLPVDDKRVCCGRRYQCHVQLRLYGQRHGRLHSDGQRHV